MAAAVEVVLDVTPPQVTFGAPLRVGAERLVAVPYTISEPEIVDAQVGAEAATIEAVRIVGASPLDQGGTVHVTALVRDEVWNEALVAAELHLPPWFQPGRAALALSAAAAPRFALTAGPPARPAMRAARAPHPALAALTAAGAALEERPGPPLTLEEDPP